MIVLRLHGGLGNQMFQLAYGLELASRGYAVRYDVSSYETDPLRCYELDVWRVTTPRARPEDLRRLPRRYGGDGWRSWLRGRRPLRKISERPIGFDPKYLQPFGDAYVSGYWQSERFFPSVRDEVRRVFQPARTVTPASLAVARRIEAVDAIALHVRRTDYLQYQFAQVCDVDYYERCVGELLERHSGLEAFVFSDDPDWCRANLSFGCPTEFVSHNNGATAYEDLWLMSRCRRHVIPNSSFSWWAAWLKEDPEGEVYAPRPWFNDPKWDSADVVPDRWRATPGSTDPAPRRVA